MTTDGRTIYRRTIYKDITEFDSTNLEGSLENIVEYLQNILKEYPDEYVELELREGYSGNIHPVVVSCRAETDEEYNVRVASERNRMEKAATHLRQQLAQLEKDLKNG